MDKTIEYYNENAQNFIDRTVNADISRSRDKFLEYIPEKGYILDIGCGSGRDSLHFLKTGYKVLGIDASHKMVEFSSKLTGQTVMHSTFQDAKLDDDIFDGIWACASLLHVDRDEMSFVIQKLFKAVKQNGIFYMCFKYGDEEFIKEDRYFNCYNEETVKNILSDLKDYQILDIYVTADGRDELSHQKWVSCIIKKC